jgi:hypothetical protein
MKYLKRLFAAFFCGGDLGASLREGSFVDSIAGWCCRVRIYSRGYFEYFEVPLEEFNEAYLSAKSP